MPGNENVIVFEDNEEEANQITEKC